MIKPLFSVFKRFHVLLYLPLILCLTGCGPHVAVTHTALADREKIPYGFPYGSSFYIVSSKDNKQLFVKEVANKIAVVLEENEYIVTNAMKANYYLVFDFGMDSSRHIVNKWNYIPGQTKTTYGTSHNSQGLGGTSYNSEFGLTNYNAHGFGQTSYQEQSQTSGTFVPVPTEVTLFTRHLTITVYDASDYRKSKQKEQLWHATATSTGESADLREIIDYLLKATFKSFGKDTKKNISSWFSRD